MEEVLLLIRAKKILNNRTSIVSRKFFVGMIMVLMITSILLIVFVYKNSYSNMVVNFVNTLNISTIYIMLYGYIFRNNSEKSKNDFLKLALQLPVSKKAISLSKFTHIWMGFIPLFIIIIVQNISHNINSQEGMSGYIGLCTLLACSQFIILSLVSGFNPFINPRKRLSKVFSFLTVIITLLSFVMIYATIGLNKDEMEYGMFGSRFVGVFEGMEFFSGTTGGVASIISITLGYLLSYDIPNRILGKRGWKV